MCVREVFFSLQKWKIVQRICITDEKGLFDRESLAPKILRFLKISKKKGGCYGGELQRSTENPTF